MAIIGVALYFSLVKNAPTYAKIAFKHTVLSRVDLPPIFAPVNSKLYPNLTSLGLNYR